MERWGFTVEFDSYYQCFLTLHCTEGGLPSRIATTYDLFSNSCFGFLEQLCFNGFIRSLYVQYADEPDVYHEVKFDDPCSCLLCCRKKRAGGDQHE